jgi:catechol 2,3-dioxygenase-like lactoylglutathione lyase family enzyme
MPKSIRPVRVNHLNLVLDDFDASVAHFRDLYGADLFLDIPRPEMHACLIEIGRVIFELFVPHVFLLNARYGPHHLGIEYQANMAMVREAVAERGIRIARDIGEAIHTHPADCFGVAFEFYDGSFHERDWPLIGGPIRSAAAWRDAHPLGLTGLKGYSVAVADIDAASAFFQSFLGAEPIYEAARPAVAGRAVGLQVADSLVELITPVGDGALGAHLHRFGDGIRATRFGVRDIAQARHYFAERGVALAPGDATGSFAVPAEANRGVIFEFAE